MITTHNIFYRNSEMMDEISDESVDLVVTSPPYPMIEMWDGIFSDQNSAIGRALRSNEGLVAFELMHQALDAVWKELGRVLRPGGIACINIGDATRSLNGHFALYTNHARILAYMQRLGFSALPAILWRKQTNAPNKFMGSGMMPPGAYVTLEHEYILILRKGGKREFKAADEKKLRRESTFFWEERNNWFSDVWMDLKGASQGLIDKAARERSAAFPFELAYRLVSMFSIKKDLVLDPFLGSGTSMFAAMAAARNFIGYELDPQMNASISSKAKAVADFANRRIIERLEAHLKFVEQRLRNQKEMKYVNKHYFFPVVTNQEKELLICSVTDIKKVGESAYEAAYVDQPQQEIIEKWTGKISQILES